MSSTKSISSFFKPVEKANAKRKRDDADDEEAVDDGAKTSPQKKSDTEEAKAKASGYDALSTLLPACWQEALAPEFKKAYFTSLTNHLKSK